MNIFRKMLLIYIIVFTAPFFILGSVKQNMAKKSSILSPNEKKIFAELVRQDQLYRSMLAKERARKRAHKVASQRTKTRVVIKMISQFKR